MDSRSNDLIDLSTYEIVLFTIDWIINLIHHQNWYSFVEKLLFSQDYLFAPEVDHQKRGEVLKLFFEHLMK